MSEATEERRMDDSWEWSTSSFELFWETSQEISSCLSWQEGRRNASTSSTACLKTLSAFVESSLLYGRRCFSNR